MNSIYVLLIMAHVYGGLAPHSQEFTSLEKCEKAKEFFLAKSGFTYGTTFAECVKK